MVKTSVKFQKNRSKTVGGVAGDNNRTAIGHYIVTLYWYSGRIVYRYLHVTSIVPFNCFIDGTRKQNDLCHDMYWHYLTLLTESNLYYAGENQTLYTK